MWLRGTMLAQTGDYLVERKSIGTYFFYTYVPFILTRCLFVCAIIYALRQFHIISYQCWFDLLYYIYYWIGSLIVSVAKSRDNFLNQREESHAATTALTEHCCSTRKTGRKNLVKQDAGKGRLQRAFEEEFILDSQGRRILQNVQLEEESNQAEKDRRVITKDSVTRFQTPFLFKN